jgi:uroporphyrinogen decarboxylase
MSSRERVLAAIEHREPDRVPIDLGGESNTGIAAGVYTCLRDRLGTDGGPVKVFDVEQMLAWVEEPVVAALGVDVLPVHSLVQAYGMRLDEWRPWHLDDGTPVQMPAGFQPVSEPDGSLALYVDGQLVARKPAAGLYFDATVELRPGDELPAVDSLELPTLGDEQLRWARGWAENLRAETDKALIGDPGVVLTRWGGYQEWLYALAAAPEYVLSFYDRKVDNMLTNLNLYHQAVGDNIDIVRMGEDYGMQQGMMISPRAFETMVAPYYERVCRWIHEHTLWKVFFHCCGGIYPIIGTLIDCGIDILNPVQTTAVGMDPVRLKADFGARVTFWGGGVDTQTVLPFGSPAEVYAQVTERIEIFGPGGGYVFAPVHNIQEQVPVDNLTAMYQAVHDHGAYPLVRRSGQ